MQGTELKFKGKSFMKQTLAPNAKKTHFALGAERKQVYEIDPGYQDRYGNSSGRGMGGPAFWFENLKAEFGKIVNKTTN